jgi:hypothetical protein
MQRGDGIKPHSEPDTKISETVGCKNNKMWQKSGLYFKQVQGEVGKNEEEK